MRSSKLIIALSVSAATALIGVSGSPATAQKPKEKQFTYGVSKNFGDSRWFDMIGQGSKKEDVGSAKFTDLVIRSTKQTFRNGGKGAPRKRVYQVGGRLIFDFQYQDEWKMSQSRCALRAPSGSFALSDPTGGRLFFPREASSLVKNDSPNTLSATAGPFTLTVPFLGQSNYTSANPSPSVNWDIEGRRNHAFVWAPAEDSAITEENFGFSGFFAGNPRSFKIEMHCDVNGLGKSIDDRFSARGSRTIRRTLTQ